MKSSSSVEAKRYMGTCMGCNQSPFAAPKPIVLPLTEGFDVTTPTGHDHAVTGRALAGMLATVSRSPSSVE